MATVSTTACDFLHGTIPPRMTMVSERWHRPGVDGEGIAITGRRGLPFQLAAVLYGTNEEVEAWLDELAGLEGTLVDVVNDWDDEADGVFLERIGPPKKEARKNPGEDWECRGEVVLQLVRV